jgi:proteasome accessory factor C
MADRRTADARLERLLYVLPAAMRDGGAELHELAETLDTSTDRILEDLEEMTARVYYQPGGWPDDVQILVDADRVRVLRATGFERPARLSGNETLCLAMALRGAVPMTHIADHGARGALKRRAEAYLGRSRDNDVHAGIEMPARDPDLEGIRETLIAAARDRRPCALWYAKAGAEDGSVRVVHPYAIAYGEGAWYAVAHCTVEDEVRVFRLDRVLAADFAEGTFVVPEDFEVDVYVRGGRVFHARESQDVREVRVRYSPRIARWVRERSQWEPDRLEEADDGSVLVRYQVTDAHWAVGHALLYGADAEVVGPAEVRALVRDVGRDLAG